MKKGLYEGQGEYIFALSAELSGGGSAEGLKGHEMCCNLKYDLKELIPSGGMLMVES